MDCSTSAPCTSDVYVVPYGARASSAGGAGGTAKALPGASILSITSTIRPGLRTISSSLQPRAHGHEHVRPAEGRDLRRPLCRRTGRAPVAVTEPFAPPACTNPYSGGVQNTLPKWAPNPLPPARGTRWCRRRRSTPTATRSTGSRSRRYEPACGDQRRQQQTQAAALRRGHRRRQEGQHPPVRAHLSLEPELRREQPDPAWGEFSVPAGQIPPPPPPPPSRVSTSRGPLSPASGAVGLDGPASARVSARVRASCSGVLEAEPPANKGSVLRIAETRWEASPRRAATTWTACR